MKHVVLGILMELVALHVFADGACSKTLSNYKVVPNSTYPFDIKGKKHCFFAFYTINPKPRVDSRGNGNLGESVWFGYYNPGDPSRVVEFPKPSDSDWGNICSINAISFVPMYPESDRSVTIIGACEKQNAINYTFPVVFNWQEDRFVLDEDVYTKLFACVSLTISDIRSYIRGRDSCYYILQNRYNNEYKGPSHCA